MAQIPPAVDVRREDFQGASMDEVLDKLLYPTNSNFGAMRDAMSNGLTFGENFNAQVLTLSLTAPDVNWQAVTGGVGFLHSWADSAGANAKVAWRMTDEGRMFLKGAPVAGASGTASIFKLSSIYAPSEQRQFLCQGWTGAAQTFYSVVVGTDGSVTPNNGTSVPNGGSVSLDQVSWEPAAPSPPVPAWSGFGWPMLMAYKIRGTPISVQVLRARDTSSSLQPAANKNLPQFTDNHRVGNVSVYWELAKQQQGQLLLRGFTGLQPLRRYRVDLLVLGS